MDGIIVMRTFGLKRDLNVIIGFLSYWIRGLTPLGVDIEEETD